MARQCHRFGRLR